MRSELAMSAIVRASFSTRWNARAADALREIDERRAVAKVVLVIRD